MSTLACRRIWLFLVLAGPATIILCADHARGQFPRPIPQPPRPTIPTFPKVQIPTPPRPEMPTFPRPNPMINPPIQTPRPNPVIIPPMPHAGDFWECGRCKGNMGSTMFPMPATCPRCGARIVNSPLNAGNPPANNPGELAPAVKVFFNAPGNNPLPVAQAGRSNVGLVIGLVVGMVVLGLIGAVGFVVVRSLANATPNRKKKKKYHGDY